MKPEERELLFKDLCSRLPYGVKALNKEEIITIRAYIPDLVIDEVGISHAVEDCKPYLFPLSSMTDTQKQEYTYIVNYISPDDTDNWKEGGFIYVEQFSQLMHFYHINHFDYRGLIPKGLANDATGLDIYKF